MHAIDFEFDNIRLSDYGFIICDFNYPSGADIASSGAMIEFKTVSRNKGKKHSLVDVKYDENLISTFHICKNPDEFDDLEISDIEFLKIMRWLHRKEFFRIRFYDNEKDCETRYYNGSFNIQKIKIKETLYGLELTMVTDSPFAHGEDQYFYHEYNDVSEYSYLYDYSNIVDSFSPKIKITCLDSGDISITNELFNSVMSFKNCTQGEIITVDGETQIVTSSLVSHDIMNDFNYEFLRIGNTFHNRNNKLTTTLPCVLEIVYSPIIIDSP